VSGNAFCRDCLTGVPDGARRCPACRSPRLLDHPELGTLSIAHMDCDAFYASVEKRDDPSLADKPLIIGGGKRGVVSTACYIARMNGVHSAMPMFKALKLCPDAVIVKPQMEKYVTVSRQIRALMEELTPLIEPLSLDEAFLDLSGTERLHGTTPALTMARLARRIEEEIGVTVSVGLSDCKFLAKIASDLDKPRGFSVIGRAEALDFLAPRPVRTIWGVGASLAGKLERDGLHRIIDLRAVAAEDLMARYGSMGKRLHDLSHARDGRSVNPREAAKSVSAETTFSEDTAALDTLDAHLWRLSERVSARCKAKDLAGRTVTLKLKTGEFRLITRSHSLPAPTQLADTIYRAGREMLDKASEGRAFRLIGIGVSTLSTADEAGGDSVDLFDPQAPLRAKAERAMDAVRARYGAEAVEKGRGLRQGKPQETGGAAPAPVPRIPR